MAGPSWLVDSKRFATKIKSASETCDPKGIQWKSNPTRACPNCDHVIDNGDVTQDWPGLPRGVKFDPSDQELLWHLLAKASMGDAKPHPFIDEFIPTVDKDDGICYAHPQNLPGVKQDGSVSHFFHRTIKAYNTGTRKRRKIQGSDHIDVRWHKTGKTKPVIIDGIHQGCKKILVLYMSTAKGEKSEKTNWVMHQYHLGTGEDEKDREYVVSKVFYQQQSKQGDKNDPELPPDTTTESMTYFTTKVDPLTPNSVTRDPQSKKGYKNDPELLPDTTTESMTYFATKVDPLTPNSVTPDPQSKQGYKNDPELPPDTTTESMTYFTTKVDPLTPNSVTPDPPRSEKHYRDHVLGVEPTHACGESSAQVQVSTFQQTTIEENGMQAGPDWEDLKWSQGESEYLLDSQELVKALSLCDDLLQSQSSCGGGEPRKNMPRLSDYARLGPEDLKRDLEECQKLSHLDHTNIELDTPPDFRLSQLEFGSQDSFLPWAGKVDD